MLADVETNCNGESDLDECKLKAPPIAQDRARSVSSSRLRKGGYVTGGVPPMPPPSE